MIVLIRPRPNACGILPGGDPRLTVAAVLLSTVLIILQLASAGAGVA